MEHLKYPIGKFDYEKEIKASDVAGLISEIEIAPSKLKKVVMNLNSQQLNTPYRPGGWTVKQVVQHLIDSHMNALIRFQLALTEENPTIKPYREDLWAEQEYQKTLSMDSSLQLLELVHERLVFLLKSMKASDFDKTYTHPQYGRIFNLRTVTGLYAWHSNHHLAHITKLMERNYDK